MSFLEIKDLKVHYPIRGGFFNKIIDHVLAVDGVDMFIEKGKTYGLIGESGSGKSTIGKAIIGLEKITSGEVIFDGKTLTKKMVRKDKEFTRDVQMIFQDAMSSLNPKKRIIDIIAEPPGKRFKNIGLLSGGEKTLTALCLMFSILMLKPSPFCILDEVEAALDDVNIERFVRQIKTFDNILFTIITHQKATMEKADSLYGVTMPERGISKVLSIRLSEASEYLDKENDNG